MTGTLIALELADSKLQQKKGDKTMAYEFTVNYGEKWQCISVEFPATPALIPDDMEFPDGKLLKVLPLGQPAQSNGPDDKDSGLEIRLPNGIWIGHTIGTPSSREEVRITFNGPDDKDAGRAIRLPNGIWIGHAIGTPSSGQEVKITFNGDGKVVEAVNAQGVKGEPDSSEGNELEAIMPLGELLVFRTPEGKVIRCVHSQGKIAQSPPSDD